MRKIILSFLLIILSFSGVFASDIEDDSILKELENKEVKELDFDFKLKSFKSCEDMETVLEKYIKDYWKKNKNKHVYYNRGIYDTALDDSMDLMETDGIKTLKVKKEGGASNDFSKTNTQVDGVDESDIVKTDGKYIYYYNSKDKYVYIVKVGDLELIKKIKIPNNFNSPILYIGENRLIILSSGYSQNIYKNKGYWINRSTKTYSIVFDTTDIKNPKLIKLYVADGSLVKSRKIGNYLYIISNNYFDIPYYTFRSENDIDFQINNIIPKSIELTKTTDSNKQNLTIKNKKLPYNLKAGNVAKCSDIEYVLPDEETLGKFDFSPSYNIISVIDLKNTDNEVKTKVIAGNNAEIYMSLDNLYLTSNIYKSYDYKCPVYARCFMPWYSRGENTLIHKINVLKNNLKYQDSTIIPGSPLTQYSMDEYRKNFRIITQTNRFLGQNSERHTDLYILDENLKLKGSLNNLGNGENFKSSRFIQDKLFLVTFKQIDPLFAIDLSDISKPKILGELKIPGYSTYLHPYDKNHLIGLGYDTKENKWGGTVNGGIKIDLYEINYNKKCGDSNLSQEEKTKCDLGDYKGIIVKQKHSLTLGDMGSGSEALRNPRMFMWKASKKLLFLPVSLHRKDSEDIYRTTDFFQGLSVIKIDKDEGIKQNFKLTHIDTAFLEAERQKECLKYKGSSSEKKCVKLIGGGEHCETKKYNYVPKYCYADSKIGEYLSRRSWKFRDNFIKRALWIGNNTYAISNKKITSSDMDTGKSVDSVEMK